MKKLLVILLTLAICLTFTACKEKAVDTTDLSNITVADSECSELEIRQLIEKNLDCYYMFYIYPIGTVGEKDDDGYYQTETNFFTDYEDFYDFVTDTYTIEKARELFSYPDEKKPLYKEVDDMLYINPDVIKPLEYEVMWDDSYTVEFLSNSTSACSFKLTTTDFDGNEYVVEGSAVNQDDEWILTDIVK